VTRTAKPFGLLGSPGSRAPLDDVEFRDDEQQTARDYPTATGFARCFDFLDEQARVGTRQCRLSAERANAVMHQPVTKTTRRRVRAFQAVTACMPDSPPRVESCNGAGEVNYPPAGQFDSISVVTAPTAAPFANGRRHNDSRCPRCRFHPAARAVTYRFSHAEATIGRSCARRPQPCFRHRFHWALNDRAAWCLRTAR